MPAKVAENGREKLSYVSTAEDMEQL